MAEQSPGAAPEVWDTPIARIGREGLQLNKAIDELTMQEVSRLNNLFNTGGDLTTRLGQTVLATGFAAASSVHSIRRLNDPQNSTYTRFWGASTSWYRGQSGVISETEAGFSGDPLTFVTVRPPFSGQPWIIAADRTQMRKATLAGPGLPVGLPAPASCTSAIAATYKTAIAAFNAGDGTNAANWFAAGMPYTPTVADVAAPVGNGIEITTDPGATGAGDPYLNLIDLPKVLNLNVLNAVAASDQDIVHVRIRISAPDLVDEVRIYFVASPFVIALDGPPGSTASAINNVTAAYAMAFRPSDYTEFLQGLVPSPTAAATLRENTLLQGFTQPGVGAVDTSVAPQTFLGPNVWSEFGVVDVPVRRSDFVKIGTAGQVGTDWSTITGICLSVLVNTNKSVKVAFNDAFLTGGSGPDTTEPGSSPYDYRVVNYDPRTGARSNGSPIMAAALFLDAVRQPINVLPAAATDVNLLQEAYRRGGSLTDNWYFIARNAANGGVIADTFADADILNTDTLPIDHFQPVATVDATGATVLNQPIPVLFGPFDDGTICGLGDPYRPGYLYACIANEPDHWPSTGGYAVEVCAPSEELMNGCVTNGQGFVLSRERGYTVHTNLAGGTGIVATPSGCVPGLAARWGFCVGTGGIYYVARDGVRVTNGGESALLSTALWPLFHNQSKNGFAPIDFSQATAIRLAVYDTDLWFLYKDTNGTRQCLVYSLVYRYWRSYTFATTLACVYQDETQTEQDAEGALLCLMGGAGNATAYTHSGFSDNGTAISYSLRTGAWDWGRPREEKLLGDVVVEANVQGGALTLQTYLNNETVTNTSQVVVGGVIRTRFQFEPFGTSPQHARNVSLDLSGSAPTTAQVTVSLAGVAVAPQPDVTMNRATTWQPLGQTEGYLYACVIDCDTGGSDRTILVECDLAGGVTTAATLTINSNGRHKLWFSWPAVHAQLVRLRPTGTCAPWMLFNVEWVSQPEPPRISGWDTNFEALGDSYFTGLDLECDTFGVAKTLVITVDGNVVVPTAPASISASGRSVVHVSLPPGRGHVYRMRATDTNPGLLYSHKWIVEAEPLEQVHWNAPFTVWDSLSDKYLKGIVIEADTYNAVKSVNVEADGAVVATITPVQHNGRAVRNYTFPQVLGRVFRIIPTDTNPSRLYQALPLFDEEPYALARWETQLIDFEFPDSGWGMILTGDLCYKATAAVTVSIQVYDALGRLLQTIVGVDPATNLAVMPSTAGAKQKRYMTFPANKGVLFKLVTTSADGTGVTLYEEESRLRLKPWAGDTIRTIRLAGANDDLDPTRNMTKATVAAGRSGGGT